MRDLSTARPALLQAKLWFEREITGRCLSLAGIRSFISYIDGRDGLEGDRTMFLDGKRTV